MKWELFWFQVSFDQDIKTKSVTLEGDVIDPAGTLTGGVNMNFQQFCKLMPCYSIISSFPFVTYDFTMIL